MVGHIVETSHDIIEVDFFSTTCSDVLQLGEGIDDQSAFRVKYENERISASKNTKTLELGRWLSGRRTHTVCTLGTKFESTVTVQKSGNG